VSNEEDKLVATKPELSSQDYSGTNIYSLYSNIEKEKPEDISSKLTITEENTKRHEDLEVLLSKSNPRKENQDLTQKKTRYESFRNELLRIEKAFSKWNFQNIKKLRDDFNVKKGAYELSKAMIKKHNKLAGVGSESWKLLWQAAEKYAMAEVHPHVSEYPSGLSANICMLCQQDLGDEAKKKQTDFDSFIKSNASAEFDQAKRILVDKRNQISNVKVPFSQDTLAEIKQDIDGFEAKYNTFETQFTKVQANWLNFLDENEISNEILISDYQEKEEISDSKVTLEQVKSDEVKAIDSSIYKEKLKCISDLVIEEVENIEGKIVANKILLEDRSTLENEKKELDALFYLESKKTELQKYLTEYSLKEKYKSCRTKLNTAQYSKKIGDLLETNGINLLKAEFTSVLSFFNTDLASKVCLEKTRTDSGTTFHQLGFSAINGSMNSVLSEGEQKVISLSGFLAECTVGGAKNTIVFDDPVNSLDQDYREAIADKLIELCKDRQIIVFTHDLYFLSLLMHGSKETNGEECKSLSLEFADSSGVITDEVPFLAKNVQQRIDNIKSELINLSLLTNGKDTALDSIRKKMRFLVEKSIEEILSNKAIQRFSKNITVKKDLLASYVVTDKEDINYLIALYGKYSITEHDGGLEIITTLPDETTIKKDLTEFSTWKDTFKTKLDTYKNNGI
jgi:energy-coupling factor transporter ATP-binding protein EcfA2